MSVPQPVIEYANRTTPKRETVNPSTLTAISFAAASALLNLWLWKCVVSEENQLILSPITLLAAPIMALIAIIIGSFGRGRAAVAAVFVAMLDLLAFGAMVVYSFAQYHPPSPVW